MTEEEYTHIRHTLAHLLGASVLALYPDSKLALGPAIENGFYYDIDASSKITDADLPAIEAKMCELLPGWTDFTREVVNVEGAKKHFAGNDYKLELIDEIIEKGEDITLYTSGGFTDLCRGGHAKHPSKDIPSGCFKLDRVAGAYWRGDEGNKMLTRIYGLALPSKAELDAYIAQQEEAKKRDHRKLGKELGLFVFSDLVGPGLPLWTPRGTIIRELLNDYVWELRKAHGYQKVTIPHITKKELYERSGHWAKYADDLFKIETRESKIYAMKPMNCPHHTQIFDSEPRSYRDMPQRYCETTMVYRDEQSGELSGLSRVLSITQDDAHVFCRESQIEDEVLAIWDIVEKFYGTFGFELKVRFSRHDPATPEKYLGGADVWKKAENALENLMTSKGVTWIDGLGEAAFYGPKIDFISHDSIGRVLQVATIQLDFNQPKNFGLTCTNEKGEKEEIVMIHCAIMGSIERFLSTLIEHVNGNFPLWLSPVEVAVIPVRDNHAVYTKEIADALAARDIRVIHFDGDENLGKRIRRAKEMRTPYMVVAGDKEVESGMLTIEKRDGTKSEMTKDDFIALLAEEIQNKK